MGRLHHQGSACDAAIILGGRIIRPGSGAVLILPLADGNALHLGRQCGLCGPHKGRTGIILKDIGIRIYQAQLGIFCVAYQSERDVRGNVNRISRLGIVIADITKISQHPGRGCRQVILADCQNPARHCFPGNQGRLRPGSVLSFPCDRHARRIQFQVCLIQKQHRSQHQMSLCPAWHIGVGQNIRVLALGLWQVGRDISRQFPLVCDVHKGLLAGCQYCRHVCFLLLKSLLHNKKTHCPVHPPW